MHLKQRLSAFLEATLTVICLGLTAWQILKGISKYLSEPEGASLSFQEVARGILPDFTVCPYDDYNMTYLEDCNLSQYSRMASEACPDPEANFHALYKSFEAMHTVRYLNGTCHPFICFNSRSFKLYPKVKPRNIFHAY